MLLHLILVPYDSAHRDWRSGAGPEHLLRAGLVAHLAAGGHTVAAVETLETATTAPPAELADGFALVRSLATAVRAARAAGRFPLVLAGNCGTSIGTLSGLSPARRAAFWFDAHGDLNTPETTTSGFVDGTGLAAALGLCWRGLTGTVPGFLPIAPQDTFLFSVRDLDAAEVRLIEEQGITLVPSARVPGDVAATLAGPGLDGAVGYLHIDLDTLDPATVGRANSLPVPGGLDVAQLTAAIRAIRARIDLGAAAIVCYAPEYDREGTVQRAAFAAIDAALGTRDS